MFQLFAAWGFVRAAMVVYFCLIVIYLFRRKNQSGFYFLRRSLIFFCMDTGQIGSKKCWLQCWPPWASGINLCWCSFKFYPELSWLVSGILLTCLWKMLRFLFVGRIRLFLRTFDPILSATIRYFKDPCRSRDGLTHTSTKHFSF